MKKSSIETFIARAKEIYGDLYTYPEGQEYKGNKVHLQIECREHGIFSKAPQEFLNKKQGCNVCGNSRKNAARKLDPIKALQELTITFPSYENFRFDGEYKHNTQKVMFKCPEHGEQAVILSFMRLGVGCPVCNIIAGLEKRRMKPEEFIKRATIVHSDRYDYSKTKYVKSTSKVIIGCVQHGDFEQEAESHLLGIGCAKCFFDSRKEVVLPFEEFKARAILAHKTKYTYAEETYKGTSERICITCPNHGQFWQLCNSHTAGSGCPKCSATGSKGQKELHEFIVSLGIAARADYRFGVGRLEVDSYLPEAKLAIEYDGLKWHSELHKKVGYHRDKRKALLSQGIELIRIFEDEWQENNYQVKQLLLNRLGLSDKVVYARNCKLVDVSNFEASIFYSTNHIQGWKKSGKHRGLAYEGVRVAVMTFTQNYAARGAVAIEGHQELARFASSSRVIGGASKLMKALVKDTAATSVVSYSDNRLFSGKMYEALNFTKVHETAPSYSYWKEGQNKRIHKSHFRHDKLQALLGEKYDPSLTEKANCESAGYFQVYDCGLTKWLWKA